MLHITSVTRCVKFILGLREHLSFCPPFPSGFVIGALFKLKQQKLKFPEKILLTTQTSVSFISPKTLKFPKITSTNKNKRL